MVTIRALQGDDFHKNTFIKYLVDVLYVLFSSCPDHNNISRLGMTPAPLLPHL